ncbi:cytochrome c oxidase assembly protein [Planococcus sp. N064]|uniref:Cytochrome c oxidase assembly protein n=1 Tax=Planococcus liqunii TaxID=3058394 RepID=A0ABT8MS61_9BACL|nr:cytochrome c oxidase assembly protein [Planococcus sp. N064]MDN7227686.1 cytochrome c oxidase assembly protein [Planococcus sp. N064]
MERGIQPEISAAAFGVALLLLTVIVVYLHAAIQSRNKFKRWPAYRSVFWISGVFSIAVSLVGPLANQAHHNFIAHMSTHLLIGMLSPLLLVLASPMTLLFRSLSVASARKVTRFLKSRPVYLLSHPFTAATLNIGGLFLLYRTDLFFLMHKHILLYGLVHFHLLAAGYLFTASIIYIDPVAHKASFQLRAVVLVSALAAHGILSKLIYASPPQTVPKSEAEMGGMLMYYGGDAIDAVLITIFCYQWFVFARPRLTVQKNG